MNSKVELKRYPENASASLVRGMLAQEGIEATVHRLSRYAGMGGAGYVLKVNEGDLNRAQALLRKSDTGVDMDEYVDAGDTSYRRCPECDSVMVRRDPFSPPKRLLCIGTLGVAFPFLEKSFHCTKCNATWRGR